MTTLEARDLVKIYRTASEEVGAVRGVTLDLEIGELVLLMGPSGSGKTTLLSILGCILAPDEGGMAIGGDEVLWNEAHLSGCRRRYFGFVYQQFNLLSSLSVRENVEVPLLLAGYEAPLARELAEHALGTVSILHRADFDPAELSGGEKQRAAIARAIAADPPIILADEPTGNLDSENSRQVMTLLRRLTRERGKSILVVSHDDRHVKYADRIFRMEDGRLTQQR